MQPNIIGTPSTSTFGSDIRKHDVLSTHDQLLSKIPVPSTNFQSFSPLFASESDEVIPTAVEDQYEKNTSVLTQTPPRSAFSDTLLKSVNVSRSSELTPKAKRLYQRATKLQNVVAVYKKRSLSFKKRLQLAEKNKWSFDSSETGLQREAVWFCIQQLSHIQNQIELECDDDDLETHYTERDIFTDNFSKYLAMEKRILDERRQADSKHDDKEIIVSCPSNDSLQVSGRNSGMKLPTNNLLKFRGEYNHWLEFKDTFESLIE
ncbi:hypothetical protein FQA39_LY12091 [Lamprigera yunnana]|nr:hypothetical protein FQA39_LY12091 [Lamprigera yunnana]